MTDPCKAAFRRAYIDRTRRCVVIETKAGSMFYLPAPFGTSYNPDRMLVRIVEQGTVDLTKWEGYPPTIRLPVER